MLACNQPPPLSVKTEHMLHLKPVFKYTPNYEIITRNLHDKERRIIILTWGPRCTQRHHKAALLQSKPAHSLFSLIQ